MASPKFENCIALRGHFKPNGPLNGSKGTVPPRKRNRLLSRIMDLPKRSLSKSGILRRLLIVQFLGWSQISKIEIELIDLIQ